MKNPAILDIQDCDNDTLLHFASGFEHTDMLKYLAGFVDVNSTGSSGKTALVVSLLNNKHKCVKVLLDLNGNANVKDTNGNLPLHHAAWLGFDDCLNELLNCDKNVDLNARTPIQQSALHLAARRGHSSTVKMLLLAGADVNIKDSDEDSPLHLAVWQGFGNCINELLNCGSSVDVNIVNIIQQTPLHLAARKGHSSIAKQLLVAGADVNIKDLDESAPLHFAAWDGFDECIIELLNYGKGVDVNITNNMKETPLHLAAQNGRSASVMVLLDRNANINFKDSDEMTPLHYAALRGSGSCVHTLLNYGRGIDINITNKDQKTSLHLAAQKGHSKNIRRLLLAGARSNIKDKHQNAAIHYAAQKGYDYCIHEFLNCGRSVDVNITNKNLETPLHLAILKRNSDTGIKSTTAKVNYEYEFQQHFGSFIEKYCNVVKYLLEGGSIINAQNNNGETPLHIAIRRNDIQSISILLKAGADVNIRNDSGISALQLAMKMKLNIFNQLLGQITSINVEDDESYKVVEKAMSMNVPGILRCLIGRPQPDVDNIPEHNELTVEYLETKLDRCIGKQDTYISLDYTSLLPSNYTNFNSLQLIFIGIGRDNTFEHLLLHPALRSFLHWKWKQVLM